MKRIILAFVVFAIIMTSPTALAAKGVVVALEEKEMVQGLTVDEAIKVRGDYIIDSPTAGWFSDEYIAIPGNFVYAESKENGVAQKNWYFPIGTHTPIRVSVNFTNMSKEKTNALSRLQCKIVYDGKYEFETTPMQSNPDQVNEKGERISRSTEAVPLEALVGARIDFMSFVPLIVRDTDASLYAYLTIDGEETYSINLRDVIETYMP